MLYILTSVWVLVEIFIFNIFCAEKLKKCQKERNLQQNFAKNVFFKVCTKTLVKCFIPRKKTVFFCLKRHLSSKPVCHVTDPKYFWIVVEDFFFSSLLTLPSVSKQPISTTFKCLMFILCLMWSSFSVALAFLKEKVGLWLKHAAAI